MNDQPKDQHPAQNSGEAKTCRHLGCHRFAERNGLCSMHAELDESFDSRLTTITATFAKPQPPEQPVCPTCGTKDSQACSAPFHVLPTEQPRREGGEWRYVVVRGYSGSFLIELKAGSKNLLIEDFETEQEAQQIAAQIVEAVNYCDGLESADFKTYPKAEKLIHEWIGLRITFEDALKVVDQLEKERDSLKAEVERVKEVASNFEGHHERCSWWRKNTSCDCGSLDQLKAALEGKK